MFNFGRRINASTYYAGHLILFIATVIFILLGETPTDSDASFLNLFTGGVMLVLLVGSIFYWLCLVRQRSNDISGKHPLLITLLVFMAAPIGLLLGLVPGEKKQNTYGKVPKRGVHLKD